MATISTVLMLVLIPTTSISALQPPLFVFQQALQQAAASAAATSILTLAFIGPSAFDSTSITRSSTTGTTRPEEVVWNLGNGNVQLTDPFDIPGLPQLQRPQLLGSGGGGAVFSWIPVPSSASSPDTATMTSKGKDAAVAVKVSWVRSAESVEKECTILQVLEKNKVQGVERCLGKKRYSKDTRRVVIAMVPVMEENSVSSIGELLKEGEGEDEVKGEDNNLVLHAVLCVIRTMVQMLSANVATTDVQPLISIKTGEVLFIDLTEAQVLSSPLSSLDIALASSFIIEMLTLIPEAYDDIASAALLEELKATNQRGAPLPGEIYEMLRGQSRFVQQDTLDYMDSVESANSPG